MPQPFFLYPDGICGTRETGLGKLKERLVMSWKVFSFLLSKLYRRIPPHDIWVWWLGRSLNWRKREANEAFRSHKSNFRRLQRRNICEVSEGVIKKWVMTDEISRSVRLSKYNRRQTLVLRSAQKNFSPWHHVMKKLSFQCASVCATNNRRSIQKSPRFASCISRSFRHSHMCCLIINSC